MTSKSSFRSSFSVPSLKESRGIIPKFKVDNKALIRLSGVIHRKPEHTVILKTNRVAVIIIVVGRCN
jgi:hypothetical protein